MKPHSKLTLIGFVAVALVFVATVARAQDPLPSWNEGPAKQAIVAFVAKVTKEGSPDFVPPAEREWAYGAESKIGTFSDTLMAEAKKQGWVVISMKNDWKRIFPFDK